MARPTHILDIFHKLWPKQGLRYILCVPTTILGREWWERERKMGERERKRKMGVRERKRKMGERERKKGERER